MRDERDPGTMEMPLPRRRGRPPKYERPMTAAERAAMYRLRQVTESCRVTTDPAELATLSDVILLNRLRKDMADGYKRNVKAILAEIARRHT